MLTAGTMREIIGSSRAQEEKVELLGFEVSYGSTCAWTIELSTLPQQRGATLLKGEASSLSSAKLKSVLGGGHTDSHGRHHATQRVARVTAERSVCEGMNCSCSSDRTGPKSMGCV